MGIEQIKNMLTGITRKYGKYFLYLVVFLLIITTIYMISLASFRKVEELVSYRFKINGIYEKWLIVKTDALSYLKSDKQENIKAKLNQSIELFNRDFMFFSRNEFDKMKQESVEIFNNSKFLMLAWQDVQKNLKEIIDTPDSFDNFSRQIYWVLNDTIVFEQYLKELLKWFDHYNSRQMLFYLRTFYFFVVIIILSAFLAFKFIKQYIREKRSREKTQQLINSIVTERETERFNLALDIHDTIIQDLSFSRMLCYDLSSSGIKKANQKKLEELTKIIMKTTGQIREITYDLMPPEIDNNDMENVLSEYCENFRNKTGIATELKVSGFKKLKMNKTQRLTIYRILQECLVNVRKHSNANSVKIKFLLAYPYIILRVTDDGIGADYSAIGSNTDHHLHIGLKGVQERVNMFDGEMNIKTMPGKGFSISIKMVLQEE